MAKTQNNNDFDINELVRTSSEHEKSLKDLQSSIENLEKRVGTNEALAASFKAAFESDKKMDKVLVTLLCNLIQKDDDFKKAIEKAIKKSDREWLIARIKSIWGFIIAALLIILGAVVEHILNHK